ncbi:hypothetical protein I4U23_020400 [Adineta vaga]|nr:hypothetical protein I4U23_020400 [Adineta vaga]
MHIESFANELFLEVFQYLTTSNIYHAFHGLNDRFDTIILEYFRTCDINFRSISKYDFDFICEHYLTQTIDHISSLCLSDDDDTPGQIEQFLSHGFTIRQFSNLKSLFLSNIRSETLMETLMIDLLSLTNLVHLNFEQCYFPSEDTQNKAILFTNYIWNLPRLIHFCFKVKYKYRQSHHFVNRYRRDRSICLHPTITSSTLQRVIIIGLEPCHIPLDQLLTCTPCLKHLVIEIHFDANNGQLIPIIQITNLVMSIRNQGSEQDFFNLLRHMPDLNRLKIDFDYSYIFTYGQKWEELINQHLTKLKRLQFRMIRHIQSWMTEERQINHILDTFRSEFWLVKRHWYIQCDWYSGREIHIYTLPYAFDKYQFLFPILSKSTYPNEINQRSYDNVRNLMYKPRFSEMSSTSHIQFYNIEHLSIDFPISNHFWTIVPNLDHLKSLDVLSNDHDELCQNQLQELLERSPRLSSIRICWKTLTSPLKQLFDSRNLSVYHLELLCYGGWLKHEKCVMLNSIIPGIHCKVLNLMVADRSCILDLINTLNHLTALNIECRSEKTSKRNKTTKDDICQWLQEQLLSAFPSIHISRQNDIIRLWIR